MIAEITPMKLTARKRTALAQPVNLLATMDNALITLSFATKSLIVLMSLMSRFTATSTNVPKLKSTNAVTNALIL